MYEFRFPDIGEGLHEGKVLELRLQPGDAVEEGDILAVVETDKVVAEIPSPKTGVLRHFGAAAGEIIKVGDPFAYLELAGGANGAEPEDGAGGTSGHRRRRGSEDTVVGQLDGGDDLLPPRDEPAVPGASEHGRHPVTEREPKRAGAVRTALATPAVRRLARDLNVDLCSVRGTGEDGRIRAQDVSQAAEAHAATPAAMPPARGAEPFGFPLIDDPLTNPAGPPAGQRLELTALRKTIARNMELSRRIPTAIVHDLGEVDALMRLRATVNRNRAVRISLQSFFVKALAGALRQVPVLNATYEPDSQNLTVYREVNVGFAVNTEAGVLLPVIRNVDTGTIPAIDRQMKQHVAAARNRSLAAGDLRGGTFTLTNFGLFGGLWAAPMIFPPQVAILGVGRIHQAPRVVDGGAIQARVVLPVSLAFDHRVVDGVPAATFLSHFLQLLRSPQELLELHAL